MCQSNCCSSPNYIVYSSFVSTCTHSRITLVGWNLLLHLYTEISMSFSNQDYDQALYNSYLGMNESVVNHGSICSHRGSLQPSPTDSYRNLQYSDIAGVFKGMCRSRFNDLQSSFPLYQWMYAFIICLIISIFLILYGSRPTIPHLQVVLHHSLAYRCTIRI